MITSMDDSPILPTRGPIADPELSGGNFYDRHWIDGYDVSGDVGADT